MIRGLVAVMAHTRQLRIALLAAAAVGDAIVDQVEAIPRVENRSGMNEVRLGEQPR